MKLAVIGSRDFNNDEFFDTQLKAFCQKHNQEAVIIISGGAKGVDTLAQNYATKYHCQMIVFKPDYKRFGRGATFIRNRLIVDNADVVLAFWDRKSTGTKYTLDYAKKQNKQVFIIDI